MRRLRTETAIRVNCFNLSPVALVLILIICIQFVFWSTFPFLLDWWREFHSGTRPCHNYSPLVGLIPPIFHWTSWCRNFDLCKASPPDKRGKRVIYIPQPLLLPSPPHTPITWYLFLSHCHQAGQCSAGKIPLCHIILGGGSASRNQRWCPELFLWIERIRFFTKTLKICHEDTWRW